MRRCPLFAVLVVALGPSCGQEAVHLDASDGPNPWTHLRFENGSEDFQFAIVSDRTGARRPGVFPAAVERLNLLRPEFVMSVGDLIDGYTSDANELDLQWLELENFVGRLEMPPLRTRFHTGRLTLRFSLRTTPKRRVWYASGGQKSNGLQKDCSEITSSPEPRS